MKARRSIVFLLVILLAATVASLLSGCGSASLDDYESEVAGLLEEATRTREEIAHHLAVEGAATEQERVEAAVAALEEAAAAAEEVASALEEVKVPGGREDGHRALMESLASERALYEGLVSALEPGGEHGGEEAGGHGEVVEEEPQGEEEGAAHREESPQGEEEHGEAPAGGGH